MLTSKLERASGSGQNWISDPALSLLQICLTLPGVSLPPNRVLSQRLPKAPENCTSLSLSVLTVSIPISLCLSPSMHVQVHSCTLHHSNLSVFNADDGAYKDYTLQLGINSADGLHTLGSHFGPLIL